MGLGRVAAAAAFAAILAAAAACELSDVALSCALGEGLTRCTAPAEAAQALGVLARAVEQERQGALVSFTVSDIYPLEGHALLVDVLSPECSIRNLTLTYLLGPWEVVRDDSSASALPLPPDARVLSDRVELSRALSEGPIVVVVPLRPRERRIFSSMLDLFLALYGAAVVIVIIVFSRSVERQRDEAAAPRATREDYSYLLAMLTPDEESVLDQLIGSGDGGGREGRTQRELRRATGFSAPKLTRILAGLEGRSIIRREPVGRTKKVFISGEVKYQRRRM